MELLLDYAKINSIDIKEVLKGWNYILFSNAAQNENHEVMRLLFERAQTLGMNIKTILANKDYKLFHHAVENTNPNVIKLLFKHAKTLEIDVRKAVLKKPSFQALEHIKSAALDALLQVLVTTKDAEIENVISQNPAIFTAPRDAEYQKIKALMYTIPSFFYDKERLILALSHINPKDKKLFAARCEEILAHYSFRNKLEEIVAYKSKNTTAKNLITDSAYKISVLRDQVGDSLFSKEGNFDEKWLKSGELTKLSLVTRDLMKYVPIKDEHDNSLDGTNKVTTFSNLSNNLKATALSFYEDFSTKKPESIKAVLTVLRQPLHKALEEQEIKAGTYNKSLALLRKAAFEKVDVINTTNDLASLEVAMPKVYEEQGLYSIEL